MPTKTVSKGQSVNTQSSSRRLVTLWDLHKHAKYPLGRPWSGWAERPADAANAQFPHVVTLSPGGYSAEGQALQARGLEARPEHLISWSAPFIPHEKYMDFGRVPFGQVEWRYDRMRSDDMTANEMYYEATALVAMERGLPIADPGTPVHFAVRRVVGNAPRDPRIAQALIAEDPWILGFDIGSEDAGNDRNDNAILRRLIAGMQQRESFMAQAMAHPQAQQVLSMTPEQLSILIAQEVAKALHAQQNGGVESAAPAIPVPLERLAQKSGMEEWKEFLAKHKGSKKSMKELGALFQAQRPALAEAVA